MPQAIPKSLSAFRFSSFYLLFSCPSYATPMSANCSQIGEKREWHFPTASSCYHIAVPKREHPPGGLCSTSFGLKSALCASPCFTKKMRIENSNSHSVVLVPPNPTIAMFIAQLHIFSSYPFASALLSPPGCSQRASGHVLCLLHLFRPSLWISVLLFECLRLPSFRPRKPQVTRQSSPPRLTRSSAAKKDQ